MNRSTEYASLGLLLLLMIPSCYRSNRETVQKDAESYIFCTGQTEGAILTVKKDGLPVIDAEPLEGNQRFAILPGMYEVLVYRDGYRIVHRKAFVVEGQAFELHIP